MKSDKQTLSTQDIELCSRLRQERAQSAATLASLVASLTDDDRACIRQPDSLPITASEVAIPPPRRHQTCDPPDVIVEQVRQDAFEPRTLSLHRASVPAEAHRLVHDQTAPAAPRAVRHAAARPSDAALTWRSARNELMRLARRDVTAEKASLLAKVDRNAKHARPTLPWEHRRGLNHGLADAQAGIVSFSLTSPALTAASRQLLAKSMDEGTGL